MTIEVYSKPGCGKCEAAKKKLGIMGLDYTEHNLEYHTTWHDGWRHDGSADVMTAHTILDTMPLFRVNGEFHDYPNAMRRIKAESEARIAGANILHLPQQSLEPVLAGANA